MPRIRSLKYEYFINEDLAQISLEARLLGLGLTTLADREGRLEDRPLRIKVLLFPYHEVDVDAAINELQAAGFLDRYIADGKRYISVVNFLKHQKPHPREAPSVIPGREKVGPRRAKARLGREKETKPNDQEIPCQTQPGGLGDLCLGDIGSSVSGSGKGNGEGDSVGTGASAVVEKSGSQDFTIWKLAVGKLMGAGMPEQDGRSFLGGLVKQYTKPTVAAAVTEMLAQEPADPKSYIVKILQNGATGNGANNRHSETAAEKRARNFSSQLAVVAELRGEGSGDRDEDASGQRGAITR